MTKQIENKTTAVDRWRGELVNANDITPRQKASVFPKVMFVLFFGVLFYVLVSAQYKRITTPTSEITTAPDVTYLERVDANPIAITTPEVSDWVLGQHDRVETAADLDALNVELKQIEIERQEIQNRQAALAAESAYLEDNALVIQTQQYASLQNQLAELDIRRGETQRKIDEAKGLAEAKAVEMQAMTNAQATAEAVRIGNIEIEAAAELEAAKMQAESDMATAKAKRELARANLWYSIAPLFSQFMLVLSCLAIVLLFAPTAARQVKKAIDSAKAPAPVRPTTRQTPDEVDEFLGAAVQRASTPPATPPKRSQNSTNAPRTLETGRIPENSKNSSQNSVEFVTTNYPWTKKVFNKSQLEIIAGGLGASRPAGIVWAVAQMEAGQGKGGRVSRQDIRAALKISGSAYKAFFDDVEECKAKIIRSRGGSVETAVIKGVAQ